MGNLDKCPRTVKEVNKYLPEGYELVVGKGYLWFDGPDVASWFTSSVSVCYLNQLTIGRWLEEFKYLQEKNKERV